MKTQVIIRSLIIWLTMMTVETAHGIARGLLIQPVIGNLRSNQIGVLLGSALIFGITLITINWMATRSLAERITIGGLWVVLTLLFEFVLGRMILDLEWDRLLSDYDISRGGLMIFGLLFMALSPAAAFLIRNRSRGSL